MFPLLSFTFACDAEDIIKIIADLFDRPEFGSNSGSNPYN